jgi:hypothetical protein
MRELSVRSLLISHLVIFILFCLIGMVGYGVILAVMHVVTGAELSDLHQRLKSDRSFRDIEFASLLSLSAVAAGWLAARISNVRPLVHGALSSGVFFLLFLSAVVYDSFHLRELDMLWRRPFSEAAQLALPLFGIIGASIFLLGRMLPGRKKSSGESPASTPDDLLRDLGIAWKWLVRLIWLCSIATFETLEFLRYRSGETYRPVFALFVAAMCAFAVWIVARGFRDRRQKRRARRLARLSVS